MVSGSVVALTIAGRYFKGAAGSQIERQLGGFKNTMKIYGNGRMLPKSERVPWGLDNYPVIIDDLAGDHEFLQDVADDSDTLVAVTVELASGVIGEGMGSLIGDLKYVSGDGQMPVTLQGAGRLTQQN